MTEEPLILNPGGRFPGLIVVDHAGDAVPARFGALGLGPDWHDSHHFRDLGVAPLARMLAARLDVPVVMGTVSRLVIDLNRWLDDPRSIAVRAEGVDIPGNLGLDPALRRARQEGIFWPYHAAVARLWDGIAARHADPVFFALHSCTRVFGGQRRPWDGGTIWNESPGLAHALTAALGPDVRIGDNQPYSGRDGLFTVDRHSWGRGQRACGFEVSNDLIATPQGQADWAGRLGAALAAVTERADA